MSENQVHIWNVDSFWSVGGAHRRVGDPGEDYAFALNSGSSSPLLAVSDGCSGSLGRTDLGSRALVISALDLMSAGVFPGSVTWQEQFQKHWESVRMTKNVDDNEATLLAGWIENDVFRVLVWGDGGIVLRYADGRQTVVRVDTCGNEPLYPVYAMTPTFREKLQSRANEKTMRVNIRIFGIDETETHEDLWFSDTMAIDGRIMTFPLQDLEAAIISTDGIFQIGSSQSGFLEDREVASDVSAFKTREGAFLRRRINRAMNDWSRRGIEPLDDLGFAAMVRCKG